MARVVLFLVVISAVWGCGNSSDEYVYTGASQGGAVSGANQVMLSVTVPGNVSGATSLEVEGAGISVKTVATTAGQLENGDFTLPGALCRAYDVLGQTMATVVVGSEGTVRFDTLPPGVYRFVVTNQDQAVVLEVIASASVSGPTVVDANTSSTAAVLVTLAAGKGNFDLRTYSHALAIDLSELITLVEAQVANPNDPWITSDGKTVVDPSVKNAVEAAVRSLPGKGKFVRGGDVPGGGTTQATEATSAVNASGAPPAGDPTLPADQLSAPPEGVDLQNAEAESLDEAGDAAESGVDSQPEEGLEGTENSPPIDQDQPAGTPEPDEESAPLSDPTLVN